MEDVESDEECLRDMDVIDGEPASGCTVEVESPDMLASDEDMESDEMESPGTSDSSSFARSLALGEMLEATPAPPMLTAPGSIFFARFFSFALRFWNQTYDGEVEK